MFPMHAGSLLFAAHHGKLGDRQGDRQQHDESLFENSIQHNKYNNMNNQTRAQQSNKKIHGFSLQKEEKCKKKQQRDQ